jgi:hypothetical protein
MSRDVLKRIFKTISLKILVDIGMSDNFSAISEIPIETQSDIAHRGYRTKCPPMQKAKDYLWIEGGG